MTRSRLSRRRKQTLALIGGAAALTVIWPGPASADTQLGGYSGIAQAYALRIQIYDPTIPIPSTPQIDGGLAYAKSTVDTGPVSRGTASYLWPGDVLGDGFGALAGNDNARYWIQVNSRYPATQTAPAHNTAQVTDGNGMTTSSDGFDTKATVTGLGIAGPDTNLLSGIGTGLRNLGGNTTSSPSAPPPALPLPVASTLAGLATIQNVKSSTDVHVAAKTVTSTAQTYMSELKLLAGLITIDGLKATATTVSDGKKATTSGSILAGDINIAGQDLGLGSDGVLLAGSHSAVPDIPDAVTSVLEQIGIGVEYAPVERSVTDAAGSLSATALVITIDTQPLRTALNLGGIVGPLRDLIQKIPKLGNQIAPLLGLGPKIVYRIADVVTTANAAPAYVGPPITGGSTPPPPQPGTGGGPYVNHGTGGGSVIEPGGDGTLPSGGPVGSGGGTTTQQPTQPTAFSFPKLGTIPKLLILGALLIAALGGWLFWSLGGFILGAGRTCAFGLASGVPDLRKG